MTLQFVFSVLGVSSFIKGCRMCHRSLLLMNSFNKTVAAIFPYSPCKLCSIHTFIFSHIIHVF